MENKKTFYIEQDYMTLVNTAFQEGKRTLSTLYEAGVPENDIRRFCNKCDYSIEPNSSCIVLDPTEQAKRAYYRKCESASVNGVDGTFENREFKPL